MPPYASLRGCGDAVHSTVALNAVQFDGDPDSDDEHAGLRTSTCWFVPAPPDRPFCSNHGLSVNIDASARPAIPHDLRRNRERYFPSSTAVIAFDTSAIVFVPSIVCILASG